MREPGPWRKAMDAALTGWSRAVHVAAGDPDDVDGAEDIDGVDGSVGRTAASCAFSLSARLRPEAFASQAAFPEMPVFRPVQASTCQFRSFQVSSGRFRLVQANRANRASWGEVGAPFRGASPMPSQGCAHGLEVPSRTNASEGSSTMPCAAGTLRTNAKATARACTGR